MFQILCFIMKYNEIFMRLLVPFAIIRSIIIITLSLCSPDSYLLKYLCSLLGNLLLKNWFMDFISKISLKIPLSEILCM